MGVCSLTARASGTNSRRQGRVAVPRYHSGAAGHQPFSHNCLFHRLLHRQTSLETPGHRITEIIDGTRHTHPRPAMRDARASPALGRTMGGRCSHHTDRSGGMDHRAAVKATPAQTIPAMNANNGARLTSLDIEPTLSGHSMGTETC